MPLVLFCLEILLSGSIAGGGGTLLLVLLAGLLVESVSARPGYLAHFNPSVSKASRHQWLADSNLDWGQDLYRLEKWIQDHPRDVIYASIFGYFTYWPKDKIDLRRLVGFPDFKGDDNLPLQPGWYCISVNLLTHETGSDKYIDLQFLRLCDSLRRRLPDEWVGDSIAVYRVTEQDLQAVHQ